MMNSSNISDDATPLVQDDRLIRLYLSQFEDEKGLVTLKDEGDQSASVAGNMLIVVPPGQEGEPAVESIRRILLWTESIDKLGGTFTLAGLVSELKFDPASKGVIEGFEMRVYYPLLGELPPACEESDVDYPYLETLRGRLLWELEPPGDEKEIRLSLTIELDQQIDPALGIVEKFVFGPTTLIFQLLEDPKVKVAEHHSLTACAGSSPASAAGNQHDTLKLKLRFVNLSSIRTASSLEPLASRLVSAACEVWWNKCGIRIDPEYSGPDAPAGFSIVERATAGASSLSFPAESNPPMIYTATDTDAVEVYLVDSLSGDASHSRIAGGVTKKCGTDDAYVILEIGKAENNTGLLSHELGHVLGLRHPGDAAPAPSDPCKSFVEGSSCSVMTPDYPHSRRNTLHNFGSVGQFPQGRVLKPLPLNQGGGQCGWNPDAEQGFFNVIRDFPYDDGIVNSVPRPQPQVQDWWTFSDVWNSNLGPQTTGDPNNRYANGTDMFNADYSPKHTEPTYAGPNYMYARVHTCQALPLTESVKVYLYIGVPGTASEPLKPLLDPSRPNPQAVTDPSLIFTAGAFPTPGEPKTLGLGWSAVGYPPSCCVFAVARTSYDTSPAIEDVISHPFDPAHPANPNVRHFHDLFNLLASNNNIAQRNLHIHQSASPSSLLAWVQIDNPFEESAPAVLEVDTTQAQGLTSLTLEIDGAIAGKIKPGEQTSIVITKALEPKGRRIIRFRATRPIDASEGTFFPIYLRFIVNDQLVSGFSHVLQVAPLSDAVLQVLDLVYGALRDVAAGCKVDQAQPLAEKAKRIVLTERLRAESSGCLGLFWRFLWPRSAWRSKVTNLSGGIASLAKSLEGRPEPECQAARKHLEKLADILISHKDTAAPAFIEEIRELADRIQEPASRLARRQSKA